MGQFDFLFLGWIARLSEVYGFFILKILSFIYHYAGVKKKMRTWALILEKLILQFYLCYFFGSLERDS